VLGRQPRPTQLFEHMPAATVRRWVGESCWSNYLTFSIIRNPFDVIVSRYFHERAVRNDGVSPGEDFGEFVRRRQQSLARNARLLMDDGRCDVKLVLRYESLVQEIESLTARLGLAPGTLGARMSEVRAKGQFRPPAVRPRQLFDRYPAALGLVREYCRWEIETFGYDGPSA